MRLFKTGVYIVCMCVFALPGLASAHATPVSYTPAAGATELKTPASISIRFTERIEMGASSLTVYGPDGSQVNQGKGTLDRNDERVLSVPIDDKGEGVYATSWQVVSVDDGHFTKGSFSFLVDQEGSMFEGAEEGVEIAYSTKLPEVFLSFFNLLGESIYLALLSFLVLIFRPLKRKSEVFAEFSPALQKMWLHLTFVAYLLFVFGSMVAFARKSAELAKLQSSTFFDASIIYLGSSVGTFAALKVLGITLLCFLFIFFSKKIFEGGSRWVLLLCAGILAAVLSLQAYVSHAAASFFLPELSIFATLVHLLAKELIIGGVFLLGVLFVFCMRRNAMNLYRSCATYFDLIGSVCLLAAGVTGVYVTWLHLKHIDNIFSTEWGTRFVALLAATLIFGFFRIFHQFVVNPRLVSRVWQRILSASLFGEITAALLVLFMSGYISMTTPPFSVEEYTFFRSAVSEEVQLSIDVHPFEHSHFRLALQEPETQEAIESEMLTITATNRELSIGPNVIETDRRSKGVYVFPIAALSPAGVWELSIISAQKEGYDARALFVIDSPAEIAESKHSDHTRLFDTFAILMLWCSAGIAVFTSVLYVHAKHQIRSLSPISTTVNPARDDQFIPWLFRVFAILVVLGLFFASVEVFGRTPFEKRCIRDGFTWQQAFPARDFESTAPNAVSGCTVHDGHYHFADEAEYIEGIQGL